MSDINGTIYSVGEDNGAQLREVVENEDGETYTATVLPAVTVRHKDSIPTPHKPREAAGGFLPGPYDFEHLFAITIWQPRGESYGDFDAVQRAVMSVPKPLFEFRPDIIFEWAEIGEEDYDDLILEDSRSITMVLKILENNVNLF